MCGICVVFLSKIQKTSVDLNKSSSLTRRGPDCQHVLTCSLKHDESAVFYGSVLHFRGRLTSQPIVNNSNIFLWNGEIFGGIEIFDCNDGHFLSEKLSLCTLDEDVLELFASIRGPWAFIYWQESQKKLWFGRDVFGRRSLLWNFDSDGAIAALSSTQIKELGDWSEVSAAGVFCMQFDIISTNSTDTQLILFPWLQYDKMSKQKVLPLSSDANLFNSVRTSEILNDVSCLTLGKYGIFCSFPPVSCQSDDIVVDSNVSASVDNISVSGEVTLYSNTDCEDLLKYASRSHFNASDELLKVLSESVRVRVTSQDQHRCHSCLLETLSSGSAESVTDKLLSVNKIQVCSNCCTCETTAESKVLTSTSSCLVCDEKSYTVPVTLSCGHARVAVLFSGGIDSLVLAALADRHVDSSEPIDLLNVAFEQNVKRSNTQQMNACPYDVPDRITGRQSLLELQKMNKNRTWNFVEINVTLEELKFQRQHHISDLIYPLNTVLDDSIGCAIWFAARGQGMLAGQNYVTTARVILVGMGADEQLAGYSRHRSRYSNEGWRGLLDEISMELQRLSYRNLGRDDRIIADHGREARIPYLDENVVSFLCSLPMHIKTNLSLPRGVGEKFLLRILAYRLGLTHGASLPKRAIQFGSRIAKSENGRERASDVCLRLI